MPGVGEGWVEANATLALPAYYRILRLAREKAGALSMSMLWGSRAFRCQR